MIKDEDLELRSEEVKEIIGETPSWILKSGVFTIVLAAIVLICLACTISYPKVISHTLSIKKIKNDFFGLSAIPLNETNIIKKGQTATISILNYPQDQFGSIKGIVDTIYFANDNYYVQIKFNNGLVSSSGIIMKPMERMVGNADIITRSDLIIKLLLGNR